MEFKKVLINEIKDIEELSNLATSIVREHFDPIIGKKQNDYMLNMFQSVPAICEQLKNGYNYYFVCDESKRKIGFLAFYPRENELYLSKFYLIKSERGKGISKKMLNFVVTKARELGLNSIILNVNRNNSAIYAYEKLGFHKIREEKNSIGNGFIMDDYVYNYNI